MRRKRRSKEGVLFCAVTNDRYELIAFVADTLFELAQMIGAPYQSLKGVRNRENPIYGYKIIKVEVGDVETEDLCQQPCGS